MEDTICKSMKSPTDSSIAEISSINEDPKSSAQTTSPPPVIHTSKARAVRNLAISSFSYFLLFSGFWSISNLESTMNAQNGMGPESQAIIYLFSMVSCFIPELLIGKFGSKSTYIIALLLSSPFIASNFHLRWDVVIITSVLYGLVSGPLNASMMLYIDEMALRYTRSSTMSRESVEAFFFGFYMLFAELTQILGNGVSYYVLEHGKHPPPPNVSIHDECGIHFQPSNNGNNTNLTPPTDHTRYILIGTFFTMAILAVIVALFLDPLKNDKKEVKGCSCVWQKIIGAAKHLRNPHQLLLLPLTIFLGMESVFFANELTQAFIACSWGVHHVGFVTICFGVCGATMAILVGPLVKCTSQMSVIILAAVINIVTCSLLFIWEPSPDVPILYFVFAGLFGITDSIWWSQVAAVYGLMFPNDREAAFSNFFFWGFLGYFISYSYANYLTIVAKIGIMLAFLTVGIILYVIGQIKIKCASRSGYIVIADSE